MVILFLRRITILFALFCATGPLASCTATQKTKSITSDSVTPTITTATPQVATDKSKDKHHNVTAQTTPTTQQRIDQLKKDQLQAFTKKYTYSSSATITTTAPQPVTIRKPKIHKKALTEYTVQSGENLYSIAARTNIYHEGLLWPLIYQANRDQIKDPQQIFPGQTLTITRKHDSSEKEKARETARNSGIFLQQHDS
jgi:nucleoid-associated protein YgaU